MKQSIISALALSAAMGLPARAQDSTDGLIILDPVTLSANRTATEANRTGASVSVITKVDLQASGGLSPLTVLAGLPGLSFSQQGGLGQSANLRIRGADTRYIAVYFDGIRITDPSSTQTALDYGTLPTLGIAGVEVLRGSQSALWGGSAVGGVINFTSAAAEEEGVHQEVALQAGDLGTAALSYSLTQKTGDLETALTLSHSQTDGYSAAAIGTERDAARLSRLSLTGKYHVTDTLTLGAAAFTQYSDVDYDGYDPFTYTLEDQDNALRRREAGARLFAELSAGNTEHVFDLTRYDIGRVYDDEFSPADYDASRTTLGWTATTEVSDQIKLVYGADWMREEASYTNLTSGSADTRQYGGFAQVLWAPRDDLDLAATLRRDEHSSYGGFTSGRLALAWRPAEGTTLRAALATGFRAPSLDELYGDYPAFFFHGNPDLTPEESTSYELGIEQEFGAGARLTATLFRLNIDNLIATSADYSSLENVAGQSVRQGLELGAEVNLGEAATLGLSYTYIDATRATGTRLALVPRHDLTLKLDAQLADRVKAGVSVHHVADRLDDFASFQMPDYTVVDARISYDLNGETEVWGGVGNLFDQDYQTSNGFAAPGRTIYVGLRKSF
ncbi:TonB-dependent receptor plug domain-containing protein [Tabrizicola fusiformis]|uniref:TonB-dependent receptor plug domain-containing protein n=1 Tax=Tabrizicola sp. SY72 TaxID=2741673 RepID=UPI00157447F0|nr:TonB-dependent receptor [Tabrizicola sp. SY72]NTT87374.1 TonB-dependent receptor [Tabrizicola sp. SY72]